jgi:hypothetical protein
MRYAVEMGSGAVINPPSFIKISSAVHTFIRGDIQRYTDYIVST